MHAINQVAFFTIFPDSVGFFIITNSTRSPHSSRDCGLHLSYLLRDDHLAVFSKGIGTLREEIISFGNIVTADRKVCTAANIDVAAVVKLYEAGTHLTHIVYICLLYTSDAADEL